MGNFKQLGLSANILKVLAKLGFETPTPIQEQAIPLLLGDDSTDFIGLAQTGTGKTAAFGLPLLDLVDTGNKATQALIMAPTRELGQQTAQQLVEFSSNNKALNVVCVYGGAAISNQIRQLKKPTQIIVATPGRLLDLIKRKAVRLDQIRYVVLDEADEMLNMGFKEDIDRILSYTPDERVTWLFSATMPDEIRKIVNKYMTDPKEVRVNHEEKVNKDIVHQYVVTTNHNKMATIRQFLDAEPDMRGIMFCRTRRTTMKIADDLKKMGYQAEALHGELSQKQRDSAMKRFKAHSMQLLVATDVAARGIDVDDLTHVLHHMLPDQLESYTHRSGRTGRIGKKGVSIAFINTREDKKIRELERKVKIKFERIEPPSGAKVEANRTQKWVDSILRTKIDKRAAKMLDSVSEQFEDVSKEELLLRLISGQLAPDSNREEKPRKERTERKERSDDRKTRKDDGKGKSRYFINVGTKDGVDRSDLLHFISDLSGIKRKQISNVKLESTCSYFEIDKGKEKGFADFFKGYEINGRELRVNRDHGEKKVKSSKKKDKPRHKNRPKDKGRRGRNRQ